MNRWATIFLWVLCFATIAVVGLWSITRFKALHALKEAHTAKKAGNWEEAVLHYHTAIAWRSPYNPYPRYAAQELYTLASEESFGAAFRLEALLQLRSGLRRSRSFLKPQGETQDRLLARADAAIARLQQSGVGRAPISRTHPANVHFVFQLIAQLAWWGWIGSVVFLIMNCFRPDGSLNWKNLAYPAAASGGAFCLWLIALGFA